ncbi:DNA-binding NarL/FixJ family response regulator [Pedobacter cryoconitis]|uniref:DNA-binding NarL/FixJ family response regulator n=1 Tax=Pedobacter cryoconitis TaxID=188932 RepID=A0A7W8YT26_9SPHI|nr:response regulator transcription factor [Pedobacter cryoconitis]MBB5621237.1 DNA-binding NarL/FixJ family response regulator [Pedobacter cryoconitis]MBB5645452.1 DNA-binding NarL/FixJ family response regulator [Pedobacter cryoconitis]
MSRIKIAIADDYAIFRDGLKVGLNQDETMEVVLEAGNGAELLDGLAQNEVDVILMDLRMPGMDGMEATKQIRKKYEHIRIIAVTLHDEDSFVVHLMEIGAHAYLLKDANPVDIREAIYAVHLHGYYFNELMNKALLKKLIHKGNFKPTFTNKVALSERELEVLQLICDEKTAIEIGSAIFLSPRSVEGIKQRLIDKIGVRNTAGLVLFAVKNGLI